MAFRFGTTLLMTIYNAGHKHMYVGRTISSYKGIKRYAEMYILYISIYRLSERLTDGKIDRTTEEVTVN